MAITIGIADAEEKRQAIYHFWYRIYIEEMGKRFDYADHEKKILYEPLDKSALIYYAEIKGEIAGTIRLNFGTEPDLPESYGRIYEFDRFYAHNMRYSCSSRFMVAGKYEKTLLPVHLAFKAFEELKRRGILFDFCLSPPELINFYRRLGYLPYKETVEDKYNGPRLPLVLVVSDSDHLQKLRSPLRRVNGTSRE